MVVGGSDTVTPPPLSRDYAEALKKRGLAVELSVLDGIDHAGVIDAPAVIAAALRLVSPD